MLESLKPDELLRAKNEMAQLHEAAIRIARSRYKMPEPKRAKHRPRKWDYGQLIGMSEFFTVQEIASTFEVSPRVISDALRRAKAAKVKK
jgi:hypothetical protein